MKKYTLPPFSESDRTPLIEARVNLIDKQQTAIASLEAKIVRLEDEIKRLKKQPKRPTIKPSGLDKANKDEQDSTSEGNKKRPGSQKRKKKATLTIDKTEYMELAPVPEGATFKGYEDFIVQDIVINTENTCYKRARWRLPEGGSVLASLPVHLKGGHFGPTLQTYILHQYHHNQVTQPLLWAQLKEWGVDISKGQLNRILIEDKTAFDKEKKAILTTGLSVSSYVNVDDTGARHQGKNGYCTHIGNEHFAWFASRPRKSRITFLELFRGEHEDYCIDEEGLAYMKAQRLPKKPHSLRKAAADVFANKATWEAHLDTLGIKQTRHRKLAREGALIGSILRHGFNRDLVIMSDDAGQFNVFLHTLCWVHAERKIRGCVALNARYAAALDTVRGFFWGLYEDLKAYQRSPSDKQKKAIERGFNSLFAMETDYASLNQVLKRLKANKTELLLVLDRPEIPLHNNLSERDIREYVKRRKVSGGTRSEQGRIARDTFASLKKTCKKLNIDFWRYIKDRITGQYAIPLLPELIRESVASASVSC